MRSDVVKKGIERAPHRALLHAVGITRSQLDGPFIGVCSSFSDIVPGHTAMRDMDRFIEKGVHTGGGVPFIFGVPAICDGIAMGHRGMNYSLPSRELIADAVESMAMAHALDALVLLTNCDKITPGMLMAAARLDIPSIVVTAGPMYSGSLERKRLSLVRDTFEAVGSCLAGKITEERLARLELEACPGPGSCQGMYTANTMACLTEALGMSTAGCACGMAGSAKKRRIAFESGARVVEMVTEGLTARKIMTGWIWHWAVPPTVSCICWRSPMTRRWTCRWSSLTGSPGKHPILPAYARQARILWRTSSSQAASRRF